MSSHALRGIQELSLWIRFRGFELIFDMGASKIREYALSRERTLRTAILDDQRRAACLLLSEPICSDR